MSDKNGSEGRIQWSRFFKKLSPYMIQKGLLYLKHYGPREFWIRLHERFEPEEIPYGPWYAAYAPDQTVLDKQRKKKFAYSPLISVVVPAYRTPEAFLRQMIDSLEAQTYENWELCIANGSPEDKTMEKVLEESAAGIPEYAGRILQRIKELRRIQMQHFPWQQENLWDFWTMMIFFLLMHFLRL